MASLHQAWLTAPIARVSHHLLLSHGLAIPARDQHVSAKLGIVLNQWTAEPATNSPADIAETAWEYALSATVHGYPSSKAAIRKSHWIVWIFSRFHVGADDMGRHPSTTRLPWV